MCRWYGIEARLPNLDKPRKRDSNTNREGLYLSGGSASGSQPNVSHSASL